MKLKMTVSALDFRDDPVVEVTATSSDMVGDGWITRKVEYEFRYYTTIDKAPALGSQVEVEITGA